MQELCAAYTNSCSFPFLQMRQWGSERTCHWLKVTQQMSEGTRFRVKIGPSSLTLPTLPICSSQPPSVWYHTSFYNLEPFFFSSQLPLPSTPNTLFFGSFSSLCSLFTKYSSIQQLRTETCGSSLEAGGEGHEQNKDPCSLWAYAFEEGKTGDKKE